MLGLGLLYTMDLILASGSTGIRSLFGFALRGWVCVLGLSLVLRSGLGLGLGSGSGLDLGLKSFG